ncbi:MAG: hypothetical protein ACOVP5_01725 [Chitinophagales bacterium]
MRSFFSTSIDYCIALVCLVFFLLPITNGVPYSDDAVVHFAADIARSSDSGNDFIQETLSSIKTWATVNGRFNPIISFINYSLNSGLENYHIYKWIMYVMNLVAFLSAALLWKKWIGRRFPSAIFLIYSLASIQFCITYHDAYNCFGLMYPFLITTGCLSIYYLAIYADSFQKKHLLISSVLWVSCLMTIEVSFLFLGILLLFFIDRKIRLNALVPHIAICALYLGFLIFLKLQIDNKPEYSGLVSHFDFNKIIWVVYCQVKSCLPTSSIFANTIPWDKYVQTASYSWITILLLILGSFASIWTNLSIKKMTPTALQILAGLVFLVGPATMISTSVKYQSEVTERWFYIVIFVQILGSAILFTFLFLSTIWFRYISLCIIPIAIGLTYIHNIHQVEKGNRMFGAFVDIKPFLLKNKTHIKSKDTIVSYNFPIQHAEMQKAILAHTKQSVSVIDLPSGANPYKIIVYQPDSINKICFKNEKNPNH